MEGSISWIISWIWTGLGVLVFDEMLHEKYQACWMSLFVVLTVDDFFLLFKVNDSDHFKGGGKLSSYVK
jgi:hypothetical protein